MFEVSNHIFDSRIISLGLSPGDHILGKIESEDVPCSLLSCCPTGKPTETTAEVDYAFAVKVRKQRANSRPFRRAIKPMHRPGQSALVSKKTGLIVDVLCHFSLHLSAMDRAISVIKMN